MWLALRKDGLPTPVIGQVPSSSRTALRNSNWPRRCWTTLATSVVFLWVEKMSESDQEHDFKAFANREEFFSRLKAKIV
jgi:hypothetical protein